jgi:hypothetical protein
MSTRVASPTLYWPADEVGSQTPGRLQPGDLSLVDHIACHYPSICFGRNPPSSCLVRQVLRSCWIRSSGESSGRSSGGRVGRQLGRLGHQQVGGSSGRSDPLVGDGCEPGRWGPKGTHVSHYEKLVDSYATLEIAHEVVLSSIKFMQPLPHTCICS